MKDFEYSGRLVLLLNEKVIGESENLDNRCIKHRSGCSLGFLGYS